MSLYEQDEYRWKLESAASMRKLATMKFANEEIQLFEESAQYLEEMAISDRRKLMGLMSVVLLHFLKIDYQPEMEGYSWKKSIKTARTRLDKLIYLLPSLRNAVSEPANTNPEAPSLFNKAYEYARKEAADETDLNLNTFPKENPYTIEQMFDEKFFGNN